MALDQKREPIVLQLFSEYEDQVVLDHYELYGLTRADTRKPGWKEDLKKRYRRKCLEVHPDKVTDEHAKKIRTAMFKQCTHAYEVLTDDDLRAAYNDGLDKFWANQKKKYSHWSWLKQKLYGAAQFFCDIVYFTAVGASAGAEAGVAIGGACGGLVGGIGGGLAGAGKGVFNAAARAQHRQQIRDQQLQQKKLGARAFHQPGSDSD